MSGHLTRYILLFIVLTVSSVGSGQTVSDSLTNRLSKAASLQDSILSLYNVTDFSPFSSGAPNLREVIRRAERLPDGDEKQSILAYLNIMSTFSTAQALLKENREDRLREYLGLYSDSKDFDIYKRVEYLFKLCVYMRLTTAGELQTNYIQELQELIDKLPQRDMLIKYVFYTQSSKAYLSKGMLTEGIDANRKLLDIIDNLKEWYAKRGIDFRNYDLSAYMCYDRLLRCYKQLSDDEVEEYYKNIVSLVNRNPQYAKLSGVRNKPRIYYLVAKKHYQEVIPMLKAQLQDPSNTEDEQIYLIEALLTAAKATGDKETLLMALEMSNDKLKSHIKSKASGSYRDLQMIYEVNDLKETNDSLLQANQEIELRRHKEQLVLGIICLVVLVILLVVVFVLYYRSRKLNSNLLKSNMLIGNERDAIRQAQKDLVKASTKANEANRMKNDFVNSFGHEIKNPLDFIVEYSKLITELVDKDRREYIQNYADVIALNSDRLLTLVNDVLDLPSLEKSRTSDMRSEVSVREICNQAMDSVREHVKPGVDLVFANDGDDDVWIETSTSRVEQVLTNLLMNAAKYTDRGSITLAYSVSPNQDELTFSVTDTGVGVDRDKVEAIFSRYSDHDSDGQTKGLGLYISRMLAKMMGGSLTLDENYKAGARFNFTIPVV